MEAATRSCPIGGDGKESTAHPGQLARGSGWQINSVLGHCSAVIPLEGKVENTCTQIGLGSANFEGSFNMHIQQGTDTIQNSIRAQKIGLDEKSTHDRLCNDDTVSHGCYAANQSDHPLLGSAVHSFNSASAFESVCTDSQTCDCSEDHSSHMIKKSGHSTDVGAVHCFNAASASESVCALTLMITPMTERAVTVCM